MNPLIFIVGPTATGKTEVAYLLAKGLKAEIISCDSMLIYREPSIITSKPPRSMLDEIRHHFVGEIPVGQPYNVFDYYRQARKKIIELLAKGARVIVCGGSGLYIKALCDGIFEGAGKDELVRRELKLRCEKEGLDVLYRELSAVDPQAAAKISLNDARRIIRALEVYHATGIPISQKQKQAQGLASQFPLAIFGLRLKRNTLYARIDRRTEEMFKQGVVEEVKSLRQLPLSITAQRIIGLREIGGFLDGRYSKEEAMERMKKNTRNFAKRQTTWFRKDKRIKWIDCDGLAAEDIKEYILSSLKHPSV